MLLVSGRDDRWYAGGWTRQTAEDHHVTDERSRRPLVRRRLDAAVLPPRSHRIADEFGLNLSKGGHVEL